MSSTPETSVHVRDKNREIYIEQYCSVFSKTVSGVIQDRFIPCSSIFWKYIPSARGARYGPAPLGSCLTSLHSYVTGWRRICILCYVTITCGQSLTKSWL